MYGGVCAACMGVIIRHMTVSERAIKRSSFIAPFLQRGKRLGAHVMSLRTLLECLLSTTFFFIKMILIFFAVLCALKKYRNLRDKPGISFAAPV